MRKRMKGIILAGGAGTRLYPVTTVASKQLHAVYDKPMIYYPLCTLMEAGIRDILIISTPHDTPRFMDLLGNGERWGISISYKVQPSPDGLPQAFLLGEEFIDGAPVALILGDNLFYGEMNLDRIVEAFDGGACIFGYTVKDPERYGVIEFDHEGRVLSLEEKPIEPKSTTAIVGLYLYDENVVELARELKPSARGELEITDLCRLYMDRQTLRLHQLGRGIAWLDTGTPAALIEAGMFIYTIEARQGMKVACPEEIAYRHGLITADELTGLIESLPRCDYAAYLGKVLADKHPGIRRVTP